MYYPASQIVPNLTTNGGEFEYSSNREQYSGSYFATSDGKFFTGVNPNSKPNFRLSQIDNTGINPNNQLQSENIPEDYYVLNDQYYYAKDVDIFAMGEPPSNPTSTFPLPTEKDYKIGEIQRYFLKKVNEILYMEVSQTTFKQYSEKSSGVNYSLYLAFSLPWIVTGQRNKAFNVNKKSVDRIERQKGIQGFKYYVKGRFDQLFRYSKNESLYTEGKEYKSSSNGKLYRGYYHIHPEKGAMEGRQHTKDFHDILIPVSGSNTQFNINKTETQIINKSSGY